MFQRCTASLALGGLLMFFLVLPGFGEGFPGDYDVTRHSDQEDISLGSFKGKPVILLFFHPDCSRCLEELSFFDSFQENLRERQVAFLPMTQEKYPPQEVTSVLKDLGIEDMEIYYDHTPGLFETLGVHRIPRTVIYDASGKVALDEKGPMDDLLLEDILEKTTLQ